MKKNQFVFLVEEESLFRVYFAAKGFDSIKCIGKYFPQTEKSIVVDIIGKGEQVVRFKDFMCSVGFEESYCFIRMAAKKDELHIISENGVQFAIVEEADQIIGIMKNTFDSVYSHFPPKEEIVNAIEREEITVIREDGKIAAFSFFEKVNKKTLCLRYFITKGDFRGKGYGNRLLHDGFLHIPDDGSVYLWIGTYNPTVQKYKKVGLTEDGLKDYILIYKGC
ncbi:MAG: GNAT family N-acetyltransferase [Flexilinea sp.]